MPLPSYDKKKLTDALEYVADLFPGYGVILTIVGPDDGDTAATVSAEDLISVLQGIIHDVRLFIDAKQ